MCTRNDNIKLYLNKMYKFDINKFKFSVWISQKYVNIASLNYIFMKIAYCGKSFVRLEYQVYSVGYKVRVEFSRESSVFRS